MTLPNELKRIVGGTGQDSGERSERTRRAESWLGVPTKQAEASAGRGQAVRPTSAASARPGRRQTENSSTAWPHWLLG